MFKIEGAQDSKAILSYQRMNLIIREEATGISKQVILISVKLFKI